MKDYAEAIGHSTTQVSNVINGREPGSYKMLLACVNQAGKKIEQCLKLPDDNSETEDALINKLLFILRNDPAGKTGITVNIDYIYEESKRRSRKHKAEQHRQSRASPVKQRPA